MKLSLKELQAFVDDYVTANNVSNATLSVVRTSTSQLVDKIGKIFTLDTKFEDKLYMFDGEQLEFGKTLEEWQEDLIEPAAYDASGTYNNAPAGASYRPPFYSVSMGRVSFKTTIYNNDFERAVHNAAQLAELIVMKTKRLYDSYAVWKYATKRELLNTYIGLVAASKTGASSYSASTGYNVGTYIKNSAEYGIVVKKITASASETSTWDKCKNAGFVILLDQVNELAQPVDATTGENFIKAVRSDIEKAQDVSEGHSLNGNTLGAAEGLVLLVKQGIMPQIEVSVQAGAFHLDKVGVPAEIIPIKDFGADTSGVYAILCDRRTFRLFNSYQAIRDHLNADGDFMNYVLHTENTAHLSRNTFVKIYKPAA